MKSLADKQESQEDIKTMLRQLFAANSTNDVVIEDIIDSPAKMKKN